MTLPGPLVTLTPTIPLSRFLPFGVRPSWPSRSAFRGPGEARGLNPPQPPHPPLKIRGGPRHLLSFWFLIAILCGPAAFLCCPLLGICGGIPACCAQISRPGLCFNFHSGREGVAPLTPFPLRSNSAENLCFGNSKSVGLLFHWFSMFIVLQNTMTQRSLSVYFRFPVQTLPHVKCIDVINALLYFRLKGSLTGRKSRDSGISVAGKSRKITEIGQR